MKVFIAGQKAFGEVVLGLARAHGHEVVGVHAPRSEDRLAAWASELMVPCKTGDLPPASIPDGTDIILAAHCTAYLAAPTRARARLGVLAYHPSLLPRHRGKDAVRWTIHMRDPVAGGTLYWMDDGVDTGPIADQRHVFVPKNATPVQLWTEKLMPLGVKMFRDALEELNGGRELPRRAQDEAHATWEPSWSRAPLSRS